MGIRFIVDDADEAAASRSANSLADLMKEIDGVEGADRLKGDSDSMDLGTIVSVVATSGAALAIAQGLAAWLRARRGAKITIERNKGTESIKVLVEGVDPDAAIRITEMILA